MMNSTRIKIYCRSFDLRLYRLSKALYESMGYACVRLTDQSADGYFYTMLRDEECDIAINVDEDCFITDCQAVQSLVEYVETNGYAWAGCQDGSIAARRANPIVVNPFFTIIDLRQIRLLYSPTVVKQFDYASNRDDMVEAFPKHLLTQYPYNFDIPLSCDPYYPFMLWVAKNFKVLYLDNSTHTDGITTMLHWQGSLMCMHTWYARYYSTPTWIAKLFNNSKKGKQKQRIDGVINEAYAIQGKAKPKFGVVDICGFAMNKIVRWMIKVPQRMMGWPKKIKRRLHSA